MLRRMSGANPVPTPNRPAGTPRPPLTTRLKLAALAWIQGNPRTVVAIAISLIVGIRVGIWIALRWVRWAWARGIWGSRLMTLRLRVRCPRCRERIRYDARRCFRCDVDVKPRGWR